MAGKSLEQRMADTKTRTKRLEAQRQRLSRQLREQVRKERTPSMIQVGGIMSRLGDDTPEKPRPFSG